MSGFRWNVLRAWIKVDRLLWKKRGHYEDGAFAALVVCFLRAADQEEPGTFESVAVLQALLDNPRPRGQWVPFLIEQGDLVRLKDGRVRLPNWRAFQEEGMSTKRVKKHRGNGDATADGTPDGTLHGTFHATPDGTPIDRGMEPLAGAKTSLRSVEGSHEPKSPGGQEARTNEVFEAMELVEVLTSRPFGWGPGSQIYDTLAADVRDLGLDRVTGEYRAVRAAADGMPIDPAGIVFGAHKRLYPIPDGPARGRAGKAPKGLGPDMAEVNHAFGD